MIVKVLVAGTLRSLMLISIAQNKQKYKRLYQVIRFHPDANVLVRGAIALVLVLPKERPNILEIYASPARVDSKYTQYAGEDV